ncbi:MAG: hypothetical protein R3D25_16120 [Geminicoccaceae bacterium]
MASPISGRSGRPADSGQPLLFIVGSEERAVAQAHAWANPDAGARKADQPASAAA